MPRPGPTNEQIEIALRKTHGMVYVAAEQIHCSPNTIKKRMAESGKLRDAQTDARGLLLDKTELKLEQAIMDGEPWAVQFFLRTQGKSRGYVERQEVTGKDGADFRLVIERVSYADTASETLPDAG